MNQVKALIREAIRILLEVTCPRCGNPDAYVGMSSVECPNPKCKFFSQRQSDDVKRPEEVQSTYQPWHGQQATTTKKTSKPWPPGGDLRKLLEHAGLYGLDTEMDDVDWEAIEALENDWGFERMGDNGVGTGDVVSPKHWRVVASPDRAQNPDDVIEAGCYDIIYWEAVSPEAKQIAHDLNKNPGQSGIEIYDDQGNPRKLNRGHFWETVKPHQPFDKDEINDLLGVVPEP